MRDSFLRPLANIIHSFFLKETKQKPIGVDRTTRFGSNTTFVSHQSNREPRRIIGHWRNRIYPQQELRVYIEPPMPQSGIYTTQYMLCSLA